MTETELNQESSALIYLQSAKGYGKVEGVTKSFQDQINESFRILDDKDYREEVKKQQYRLFEKLNGQQIHFAKDYLQYFMDIQLSITKRTS